MHILKKLLTVLCVFILSACNTTTAPKDYSPTSNNSNSIADIKGEWIGVSVSRNRNLTVFSIDFDTMQENGLNNYSVEILQETYSRDYGMGFRDFYAVYGVNIVVDPASNSMTLTEGRRAVGQSQSFMLAGIKLYLDPANELLGGVSTPTSNVTSGAAIWLTPADEFDNQRKMYSTYNIHNPFPFSGPNPDELVEWLSPHIEANKEVDTKSLMFPKTIGLLRSAEFEKVMGKKFLNLTTADVAEFTSTFRFVKTRYPRYRGYITFDFASNFRARGSLHINQTYVLALTPMIHNMLGQLNHLERIPSSEGGLASVIELENAIKKYRYLFQTTELTNSHNKIEAVYARLAVPILKERQSIIARMPDNYDKFKKINDWFASPLWSYMNSTDIDKNFLDLKNFKELQLAFYDIEKNRQQSVIRNKRGIWETLTESNLAQGVLIALGTYFVIDQFLSSDKVQFADTVDLNSLSPETRSCLKNIQDSIAYCSTTFPYDDCDYYGRCQKHWTCGSFFANSDCVNELESYGESLESTSYYCENANPTNFHTDINVVAYNMCQ